MTSLNAPSHLPPDGLLSADGPLSADGTVTVRGRPAPYRIRYSQRARTAAVHLHARRGIEVVLPTGTPPRAAAALLREKAAWLERHADDVHRARRAPPLRSGARLPLRGDWLTLQVRPAPVPRVVTRNGALAVDAPAPHNQAALRRQLERWYRALARRIVCERLAALARPDDGPLRRFAIRGQDTCWGSCSARGTLSFNWRLIMAPPPVLDAVIAHELLHLRLPDHSPAFWAALDRRAPGHRRCRRWLDANAYRLSL